MSKVKLMKISSILIFVIVSQSSNAEYQLNLGYNAFAAPADICASQEQVQEFDGLTRLILDSGVVDSCVTSGNYAHAYSEGNMGRGYMAIKLEATDGESVSANVQFIDNFIFSLPADMESTVVSVTMTTSGSSSGVVQGGSIRLNVDSQSDHAPAIGSFQFPYSVTLTDDFVRDGDPMLVSGFIFAANQLSQATIELYSQVTIELEPGVTFVSESGVTMADSDDDLVNDSLDNCSAINNPSQIDTDSDGYGNACDTDTNNDCVTNFLDISAFAANFPGTDPLFDFNGDGAVNFLDLSLLSNSFLMLPGPSGTTTICQ